MRPRRARSRLGRGRTMLAAQALVMGSALTQGEARAADGPALRDGSYGRLETDLGLSLEAGVAETFRGEALVGRLATTYLHTIGTYLAYADGLGTRERSSPRSVAAGVELKPLFLARFATDAERGPALLDLLADSAALSLGIYGAAGPGGECAATAYDCWELGMEVGLGVELPLLPRAEGPFVALRGAARFAGEEPAAGPADRPTVGGIAMLSLGYRLLVMAHLVDAADLP